jgi:tetratricopeptide (TPR) repeat protein
MGDDAEALIVAGTEHYKEGRLVQAVDCFSRAIQIDPRVASAWYNRSLVRRSLGEHDLAEVDYLESVGLDPRVVDHWNGQAKVAAYAFVDLGNHAFEQGDFSQALAHFEEAIHFDPMMADPYIGRGAVHQEAGNLDRAISSYDQAIQLEPGSVIALYNRGISHHLCGDHTRAVEDLSLALSLGSRDPDVLYWRSVSYEALGDHEKALADREESARLGSTDT